MDNQPTPCPKPEKRAAIGKPTAGNHPSQANGRVMQPLNFTAALHDISSFDELPFPEDECFVLAEAYVMMEQEYVMWNEDYALQPNKKTVNGKHAFDEEVVTFPLQEID